MTDELAKLFNNTRIMLHDQRLAEGRMLEDIAEKVFDAYRAALGDDFTTQEVLNASSYGSNVRDWNSIDPEMQGILGDLCVKHPESVDREKVSKILSGGAVEYLCEKGLDISDEQAQLFPDLMEYIMQGLELAGVKFSNDVRQARILGVKPLVNYKDWLVSGGQTFMDLGQYDLELRFTKNAIKAHQNVFTTALVTAGDVKVNLGISHEKIKGIIKAGIKTNNYSQGSPFVVTYETEDGQKGDIDVLRASVTSLTEKADEHRLYDLLYEKKIDSELGFENLGYEGSIEALVGLPQNTSQELRANVWRKHLKKFGADFSKNAEVVLVSSSSKEKVTFFYGTQDVNGQDNGVMVAFAFDERYGDKYVFVCNRNKMEGYISEAERVRDKFETDYKPLLEPMAVRSYVENKQRLTQP